MSQARVLSDREVRKVLLFIAGRKHASRNRALFTTQKHPDRGFTPNTGAQVFHYIYRGAGISGASSHSGRRGFITNLAAKGVAARVLMQLSGHRSLQVLQRYIDTDPQTVRKAVELI